MSARRKKPADAGRIIRAAQAAERLAPVFHPLWSSADDHAVLSARAAGENFTVIAARLGRPRLAVEQRWHRLRMVRDALRLLEAYGLSDERYPDHTAVSYG